MKNIKKIAIIIILSVFSLLFSSCGNKKDDYKYTIISSSFPGYDFVRAIVKDADVEVKMLLKPGSEMHEYEPTPQDIIDIEKCDIFIYVGGDSDSWINDVLSDIDTSKVKIIKLMDLVELKEEGKALESEEDEDEEYDEHVWTSPVNAIQIIDKVKKEIIKMDEDNKEIYEKNAIDYINQIQEIDFQLKELVANSKRNEIIFGDRFPIRYFTDEYNLKYYAAFKGCSEQTEASAKTISYLVDKVKKDKIPVVFKIELSSGNIANAIASETNTKVLEFHSAHNITQNDFNNGVTYVDIMKRNIEVLKEALN